MDEIVEITLKPEEAFSEEAIQLSLASKLGLSAKEIKPYSVINRSIDARRREVKYVLRLQIGLPQSEYLKSDFKSTYQNVAGKEEVLIIGAGPAGLFAALRLLESGVKPVVIERGKDVRARRRDIAAISKQHLVDENSNYCFGEGGAGTYSDGKLYTRSKKRGDVNKVLQVLVEHGADPEILINAHPHIGTNKLPQIIANIRESIIQHGGEVHFNSKLTDILVSENKLKACVINENQTVKCNRLILATGHSARDIFSLLESKGIEVEAKPFALGVRIEHPQLLIDQIQYHCDDRNPFLPPASYSLAEQVSGRGVYSFCMCPGGVIAPCATKQDEIVVNGWSPSRRDQPSANSGIVVELRLSDFGSASPLAGLAFQRSIEQAAWSMAGKTQKAPAQKMVDFVNNKISNDLPSTSYAPGIESGNLNELFPNFISSSLREAFISYGKKMRGYFTNEAIIHAPESRTSSPVRIPRDKTSLQHIRVEGLYPCGEGAGYAGGIVSAAIDGEKCAAVCALSLRN